MTRDRLVSVRGGLLAVVSAALVAGLVLTLTSGDGHRGAAQPAPATTSTTTSFAAQGLSRQTPDTVTPSGSPAQEQVDQNLAQGQLPDLSQLEAVKVPQPAISGGWPRLPVATAPETWAQTFVGGSAGHPLLPAVAQRPGILAASPRSPVPAAGRPGVGGGQDPISVGA